MASHHQRSGLPEGLFVVSRESLSKDTPLPRAGIAKASTVRASTAEVSNDPGSAYSSRAGANRDHDDSPPPWWASLGSENRKVFNIGVVAVSAFYALIMISLLAAVLLGVYTPEGRNAVANAPGAERNVISQASAPVTGSIGK